MTDNERNNPYHGAMIAARGLAAELLTCAHVEASNKHCDVFKIARLVNKAQSIQMYADRLERQIV